MAPHTLGYFYLQEEKKQNLCTLKKYEVKNYSLAQQRPISRKQVLKENF